MRKRSESQRFKISDVEPLDIMTLRFILDPIYLKREKYYSSSLDKISRWTIKTIVQEHQSRVNSQGYKFSMMKEFKVLEGNEILPKEPYGLTYLYSRVKYRLSSNWKHSSSTLSPGRQDMYDLLTRDTQGTSQGIPVLLEPEFNQYCFKFIKRYFPKFYEECMKL